MIKIVIPKIKAEWQYVAYAMGYKVYEVNDIQKDSCDSKERCVKLLAKWLTASDHFANKTWQTLLGYIKEVDELTSAVEEIEKELIECKEN